MEWILISPNTTEWSYIWDYVAKHPLNEGLADPDAPNEDQKWQYIGSFMEKDKVIHELRHRTHPVTNKAEYLRFMASPDLTPDQICKKFRL